MQISFLGCGKGVRGDEPLRLRLFLPPIGKCHFLFFVMLQTSFSLSPFSSHPRPWDWEAKQATMERGRGWHFHRGGGGGGSAAPRAAIGASLILTEGRKKGRTVVPLENGALENPCSPPSFLRGKALLPWRSTYMMGGSARFPHFSEKKREEKLHTHAFQEDRKDAEDYLSSQRWRRCKNKQHFLSLKNEIFASFSPPFFSVGDRKQTKTLDINLL